MSLLAEFRAICGADHAVPATSRDAVLGSTPRWVVRPRTTEEVAGVLRLAADEQLRTVVRGAGSKLHWGPAPSAVDLVLDTTRMTGIVTHQPQESTATVRAGSRLAALAEQLAVAGQRLSLDPPGSSTVGGTVATATAGPLRMSYGDVVDLLLDATLVRGDGTVVRGSSDAAGDVAGHTMIDLLSGGFGALGVVTELTFRLHTRPPVRRWLVREVASPAEVRALTAPLAAAVPAPAAIEVYSPCGPDQIGVLVEGTAEEVAERLPGFVTALGGECHGVDLDRVDLQHQGAVRRDGLTDVVEVAVGAPGEVHNAGVVKISDRPPTWWSRFPFAPGDVALRITTPPCEILTAGYIVRDSAGGAPVRTRWSPGVAVMYAALPCDTDPGRVVQMIEGIRQTLIAREGSCVVLHAPEVIRKRVDMWGPCPEPELQRQIKNQYDPLGLLAPGRLPVP